MAEKGGLAGKSFLQRALPILCLILVVAAGFGLRASVWSAWKKTPEHGFYKGSPVLRECDGYHYLGLARDIKEGKGGGTEAGRQSHIPPFLSLLAAGLSRATGASLEWCAAWIPVVLGASAAIPLYLLGAALGGSWIAGAVAGILGTTAPVWVFRTGFAFFDTDCLIVPLSLWIAWAALRLRENGRSKALLFGAVWAGLSGLLLWSWDTNAIVVVYLAAVPAVLALVTGEEGQNRRKLLLALSAGIILAAVLANYGISGLLQQIKNLEDTVFVREKSPFPSPSLFLSELERHDFEYIARMTSGSVFGFLAGMLGLALAARNKWREAIALLPLASIGILSFFSGQRFMIFLAPVAAVGAGVLASGVWRRYAASHWRWAVPAVAALLIGLTLINEIPVNVIWPYVHPGVMEGIEAAGKLTPEGSLIWSGWSVGYPISYVSRRTPVADGGMGGSGQALVANSLPFATENFRLSANWIQFYAARGEQGLGAFWSRSGGPAGKLDILKEAMAAGPSGAGKILAAAGLREPPAGILSWESFLFPRSKRRIFLFLDFDLLRSFDGWYRPGAWRPGYPGSEAGPYLVFQGVRGTGQNISGEGIEADLQSGIALVGSMQANLSEVFLRDRESENARKYRESGPRLEVYLPGGLAVLTLPEFTHSVFHKLFVRHQTDSKYFKPVLLNSPLYQIWEVTGDSFGQ
jgi:hypothetical protein